MSKYSHPKGAYIHAWRPGHWYTWMFEVGNSAPGSQVDTWTVYPSTNSISGQVPAPGQSTKSIKFLGNFDTQEACDAACKGSSTPCKGWTWHETTFDKAWAKGCYGHKDDNWGATHQADVVSARGPHVVGPKFHFSAGGNQGGEGNDGAGEWFIEGVREELDEVNEFIYDAAAKQLLVIFNGTGAPPSHLEVEVPALASLIEFRGVSQHAPIRNVDIRGLTITANRPTFMDPRGNPSGGDWALERTGALLLENTENISISGNYFTRLDSNGVSINGYNRNVTIDENEFVWLGQNAVAAWGRPDDNNGLNGRFPRYTNIVNNFAHEIGHIQKQSSFFFQAETAQTHIEGNIVFNIPRAAINFNDGFGGGNEIIHNLLFNTCRESSDHGAFNSWDRLPYITDVRDGTPSSVPAVNNVHRNFIVANYAADGGCLDNDDGSSYYDIHHNFCVFGGHKSDFDGNKKRSFNNIHVYPSVYGTTCLNIGAQGPPPKGYAEAYFNNTCILPEAGDLYLNVYSFELNDPAAFNDGLILDGNVIYAPGSSATVLTSGGKKTSFADFQKDGFDQQSQIKDADKINAAIIVQWGKEVLEMTSHELADSVMI